MRQISKAEAHLLLNRAIMPEKEEEAAVKEEEAEDEEEEREEPTQREEDNPQEALLVQQRAVSASRVPPALLDRKERPDSQENMETMVSPERSAAAPAPSETVEDSIMKAVPRALLAHREFPAIEEPR